MKLPFATPNAKALAEDPGASQKWPKDTWIGVLIAANFLQEGHKPNHD